MPCLELGQVRARLDPLSQLGSDFESAGIEHFEHRFPCLLAAPLLSALSVVLPREVALVFVVALHECLKCGLCRVIQPTEDEINVQARPLVINPTHRAQHSPSDVEPHRLAPVRQPGEDGELGVSPGDPELGAKLREAERRTALAHVVTTFFDGSTAQAVAALLDGSARALTKEERARLTSLIRHASEEGR